MGGDVRSVSDDPLGHLAHREAQVHRGLLDPAEGLRLRQLELLLEHALGAVDGLAGLEPLLQVGDGQQAVDRATELRPDLVILDIQMPVLDGLSAAERIAGDRIAPVIVLTAFSQRDLVERARDAGAMAYLVKPFNKNDLVPAIEVARARFAEMSALDSEVRSLEDRLEARKSIERAKGRLMTDQGMTEAEAFRHIQRTAMNERTSMKALAQTILAPDPAPEGTSS